MTHVSARPFLRESFLGQESLTPLLCYCVEPRVLARMIVEERATSCTLQSNTFNNVSLR
jgi:hypothetical protein